MFKFAVLIIAIFVAFPASAETLQQALVKAYQTNPTLQQAQAKLRAVDEGVPLAKSGARPSLDFNASVGHDTAVTGGAQTNFSPRSLGLAVTQPIYKGGRIDAGISSAEKAVLAERANLLDAEQALFLSVAQSYFDVWRDQSLVKLNRKNEEVLLQELKAAKDRFAVGEATRTDVSQAESRYSGAIAARIESEGALANDKATYEKVIGNPPSELKAPDIDFALPASLEETIRQALEQNPKVISAKYTAEGARHDVDIAEGALLPELNIEAGAGRNWENSVLSKGSTDSTEIAARLTMPLYRGGADYARTRAAKETASQKQVAVHSALDTAHETAVSAWESLKTAEATIRARQKQMEAAQLAFEGVKEESKVGTRTVLDRLNAEAEVLQAQVNLVQSQRDKAVAMYNVKAAVGDLTAAKLALALTPYDPAEHYEQAKDAWIGLGIGLGPDLAPAPPDAAPEQQKNPETKPVSPIQPEKELAKP